MKQEWYVRRQGKVYGPYTQSTLYVDSVLPADELGQAPQGPWQSASSFTGFATKPKLSVPDDEPVKTNNTLGGCLGCGVVVFIGFVVLVMVVTAQIGQGIGVFFEAVEDSWNHPLNPGTWF